MCALFPYHLMYMLSNFLSFHHDLQNYVIAPEMKKKIARRLIFGK